MKSVPFYPVPAAKTMGGNFFEEVIQIEGIKERMVFKTHFDDIVHLYKEVPQGVLIPRQCSLPGEDYTTKGQKISFKSFFIPTGETQKQLTDKSTELLLGGESHILQASTGYGKSYIGSEIIGRVGRKALILVPKTDILDQWRQALKEVLHLKDSEIGYIQGNHCSVVGKKVVIGMIHSCCKEGRYDPWVYREFGLLLNDEKVHPDSLVTTDKGHLRIQDIVQQKMKVKVLSVHEKTGHYERKPIKDYFEVESWGSINYKLYHYNGSIIVSEHHPVRLVSGWVYAKDVKEGDYFCTDTGLKKCLRIKEVASTKKMYDITVEGNHNYFINGVLVHNCHKVSATTFSQAMWLWPAKLRLGLSVSKESAVTIRKQGVICTGRIESFYKSEKDEYNPDFEVRVNVDGYFTWGLVSNFIRHKLGAKKMYRITTTTGRYLDVTEDHSTLRIQNRKLVECSPEDLVTGDLFLVDTATWEEGGKDFIDFFDVAGFSEFFISFVTLESIEEFLVSKGVAYKAKLRYKYKNGRHGTYLPAGSTSLKGTTPDSFVYAEGTTAVCPLKINLQDVAELAGYYAGNGSGRSGRVSLVCPLHREEYVRGLIPGYVKVQEDYNEKSVELRFSNKMLCRLLCGLVPGKAAIKALHSCLYTTTSITRKLFLRGLMMSDGHFSFKFQNRRRMYIVTTSELLAQGVSVLCGSLGVYASISKRPPELGGLIKGRQVVGCHSSYNVNFSLWAFEEIIDGRRGKRKVTQIDTNGSVVRVKKIEVLPYESTEFVYDFSVPTVENFVANGIVCHNTATPYRLDGKDFVFFSHIGEVKVKSEALLLTPRIIRVASKVKLPMVKKMIMNPSTGKAEYVTVKLPHAAGKCGHITKILINNDARNRLITRFVKQAYDKGRRIIIFSENRKVHLVDLELHLIALGVPKKDIGWYVGGKKQKELNLVKTKPVILSTYQMASLGTNIPWLDTAVLATPRSDVVQIVGRILREYEDKQEPVVFDVVDTDSNVFAAYANKRLAWYHKIGAKVANT